MRIRRISLNYGRADLELANVGQRMAAFLAAGATPQLAYSDTLGPKDIDRQELISYVHLLRFGPRSTRSPRRVFLPIKVIARMVRVSP
jgi:hypothetical protein